jgi:hypothetical protein
MANTSPSRLGAVNGAASNYADANAIFLKKFAGEVLTTFEETNVMKSLHTIRTINNGKSAQFPVTGTATAGYHVVGEDLINSSNSGGVQSIKHAQKIINIDELLVASTFIANLDELKNHYDVRSIYSNELGRALSNKFDRQTIQVGLLNAATFSGGAATAASATITGNKNGSVVHATAGTDTDDVRYLGNGSADMDTNGTRLAKAIYAAAQLLDEKDVPSADRFVLVSPQRYYNLVQAETSGGAALAINRDWDGRGSYAEGSVLKVAGVTVVKTNHIPSATISEETPGPNNSYEGEFGTEVMGLVFHKSSIGTVKLQDLATESEYQIQRQGTLMVAKYAMGHGGLRPECGVVLMND